MFVYKLSFAVIPDLIRYPWFDRLTMTGHPELVEGLDSGCLRHLLLVKDCRNDEQRELCIKK